MDVHVSDSIDGRLRSDSDRMGDSDDDVAFEATPLIGVDGSVLIELKSDESGRVLPGQEELALAAGEACRDLVEAPALWQTPPDAVAYEQMLDVRRCLAAHGYETPEPPSEDVWLESFAAGTPAYAPFEQLLGPNAPSIRDDVVAELFQTCPQSGYGIVKAATGG